MSTLSADFELEIGDIVYFRTEVDVPVANKRPVAYQVHELLVQKCHGGIQKAVGLIGHTGWVPEFALTKDLGPWLNEVAEDKMRQDAEWAALGFAQAARSFR